MPTGEKERIGRCNGFWSQDEKSNMQSLLLYKASQRHKVKQPTLHKRESVHPPTERVGPPALIQTKARRAYTGGWMHNRSRDPFKER